MAKTSTSSIPAQHWYDKAADAMVRHGVKLFDWTCQQELGLRITECDAVQKTPEFMCALRAARNRFYKELATDPTRSKNAALGRLLYAIDKLLEVEQYDKAVAAIAQLYKAEGWTQDAGTVTIFNEISGKDIDAIRKRLEKPKAGFVPTDQNDGQPAKALD